MRHALLAGANAAIAGVVGKVAFDADAVLVRHGLSLVGVSELMASRPAASSVVRRLHGTLLQVVPARAAIFALLLFVNASVFRFLARGMDESGSSMRITVVTSAVNFLCSALLGALLFGEPLSWRWVCGSSLMVTGMYLVATTKLQ